LRIPRVVDAASTDQICALIKQSSCTVVFHESAPSALSELKLPLGISDVVIIIGPEGGITDEELARFSDAGAVLSRMGRPVLRSAHAGIAAVSALCAKLQVW